MGDDEARIAKAMAEGKVPHGISAAYLLETRDRSSEIAILFVLALAFLIVCFRSFSRLFVVKIFIGLDDILCVISLLLQIAFVTLCILLIRLGSGRHYDYIQYILSAESVRKTETLDFAAHLIYTTALFMCRLSGLAFYWRICDRQRGFRITITCATAFLTCLYLPQMFLIIFHCRPVTSIWPYEWQPSADQYTCLQWGTVYVVNSSFSLISDLVIFAIPIFIIRSLHLPLKRKLQVSCVLLPGVLVIAISITRLYLVAIGQWQPDESWSYDPLLAVENAEIGATIIALSVPALKPLLGSWANNFHASFRSPQESNNNSEGNRRLRRKNSDDFYHGRCGSTPDGSDMVDFREMLDARPETRPP